MSTHLARKCYSKKGGTCQFSTIKTLLPLLFILLSAESLAAEPLVELLQQWNEKRLNSSSGYRFSGVILVRKNETDLMRFSSGDTVTANSRFMLGSLSKPLFATWYLSKYANDLNTPLSSSALPNFIKQANDALTPQMLLSHTSGINRRGDALIEGNRQFEYSNANYQILAQTLFNNAEQSLSGELNEFFAKHKLAVLAKTGDFKLLYLSVPGLAPAFDDNPSTSANQGQQPNLDPKISHRRQAAYPESTPLSLASGTLIGSADGIADFQQKLHSGKLLSSKAYQAMVTPYGTREHRWGALGYGLGLQIATNPLEYSHGGYIPGFMSLMLYYPETGLQLVMLENVSADLSNPQKAFAHQDELRALLRAVQRKHLNTH